MRRVLGGKENEEIPLSPDPFTGGAEAGMREFGEEEAHPV